VEPTNETAGIADMIGVDEREYLLQRKHGDIVLIFLVYSRASADHGDI